MSAAADKEIKPPSVLPAALSLFTSTGTLVCCALPALFVTIGMGAVTAGLVEAVPGITWMGKNKDIVFPIAYLMVAIAGFWQWRARNMPCPVDPAKARACTRMRRISWALWWVSVVALIIGTAFGLFGGFMYELLN